MGMFVKPHESTRLLTASSLLARQLMAAQQTSVANLLWITPPLPPPPLRPPPPQPRMLSPMLTNNQQPPAQPQPRVPVVKSELPPMPPTPTQQQQQSADEPTELKRGLWSQTEHELFLEAMKIYPLGPWRSIADHIGTRSIKQVQTHAQKYQQKVFRRQRGLRKQKKRLTRPEHRVDQMTTGSIVRRLRVARAVINSPRSPASFPMMMPPLQHQHHQHQHQQQQHQQQHLQQPFLLVSSDAMPPKSFASLPPTAPGVATASSMSINYLEPLPFTPGPVDMSAQWYQMNRTDFHESLQLFLEQP